MSMFRVLTVASLGAVFMSAAAVAQTTVQPDGRGGYTVLDQQGNLSAVRPDGRGGYSIITNPEPKFSGSGNPNSPDRPPLDPQRPSYRSTISPGSSGAYNEPPAYQEQYRSVPTLQFPQSGGFNEGFRQSEERRKFQQRNARERLDLEAQREALDRSRAVDEAWLDALGRSRSGDETSPEAASCQRATLFRDLVDELVSRGLGREAFDATRQQQREEERCREITSSREQTRGLFDAARDAFDLHDSLSRTQISSAVMTKLKDLRARFPRYRQLDDAGLLGMTYFEYYADKIDPATFIARISEPATLLDEVEQSR